MQTQKKARLFWIPAVTVLLFALPALAQQGGTENSPPPTQNPPQNSTQNPAPTPTQNGPQVPETNRTVAPRVEKIVVPAGTRLPLVLHNGISTKSVKPGDKVYLETLFPILVGEKIVIPAGSYVSGEVTAAKRPGRIKGRGEIMLRLTTLILTNGYTVSLIATPTGADTGDNDGVEKEGKIKGDSNKAGDVGTVVKTTGAGAGIGALAGRSASGAGLGAAIGGAVGLAAVLLTRGPEVELPRGTTLDIMLDRPLTLDASRVQFDDPGRASTLAGPPNRKPTRSTTPF
jgi:hypothetical protein